METEIEEAQKRVAMHEEMLALQKDALRKSKKKLAILKRNKRKSNALRIRLTPWYSAARNTYWYMFSTLRAYPIELDKNENWFLMCGRGLTTRSFEYEFVFELTPSYETLLREFASRVKINKRKRIIKCANIHVSILLLQAGFIFKWVLYKYRTKNGTVRYSTVKHLYLLRVARSAGEFDVER